MVKKAEKLNSEYSKTSYIDSKGNLIGYLELSSNCYVDFDRKDIFLDGAAQHISVKNIILLEKLIVSSPRIVGYEDLFLAYYGNSYYSVKADRQVLRNFKNALSKYCNISNSYDEGYKIELDIKPKRASADEMDIDNNPRPFSISGKNSGNAVLAADGKSDEYVFSSKFLNAGALALENAPVFKVVEEIGSLSKVFDRITAVETLLPETEPTFYPACVIGRLYDCIIAGCRDDSCREVLKIKGPLGSYKNRIMQYLYLLVEKKDKDIIPFYIDVSSYEKTAEINSDVSEDAFIKPLKDDIDEINSLIRSNPDKTPLLMIDGIRDFSYGNESLYYCIKDSLKKTDCKVVTCLDTDYTVNNQRIFGAHPLGSNNFATYARIKSMPLYKRTECVEFIHDCIRVFNVGIASNMTAEKIYDYLLRLNFISVDAYWLVNMLNTVLGNMLSNKETLSAIYDSLCLSLFESSKTVESAAKLAYEYELGSSDFNKVSFCLDPISEPIRKHRSILDFLIAKHYVRKISELYLNPPEGKKLEETLRFFNMVLPKNITRFVVSMINSNEDLEHGIMILAKKYYDRLSLFGKSELTFWMARLNNPKRKDECLRLLRSFNTKEINNYNSTQFENSETKKDAAFLLRGINVSLIYEGDRVALIYYINSLLNDKVANSVNRGFHLEYYGDKPYIPNKTLLDYEDDVTVGENTLTVLCLSMDRKIRRRETNSYVAILETVTICNLIQARLEKSDEEDVLDVKQYIEKCLGYLEWIIVQRTTRAVPNLGKYFAWIHSEFKRILREGKNSPDGKVSYDRAAVYNKFSHACSVKRTGWVKCEVPEPENIVEHMYNCWLLGMMYLPDECDLADYDKNRILQMLLIHDLGETETGDINRPEKAGNQKHYDRQESTVMQALLYSGTYPSAANISNYLERWFEWDEKRGTNYCVAKDIDNLQTIFTFCVYYLENPELFTEDDIFYWLDGLGDLETDIVRDISDVLIVNNPKFEKIIEISRK